MTNQQGDCHEALEIVYHEWRLHFCNTRIDSCL